MNKSRFFISIYFSRWKQFLLLFWMGFLIFPFMVFGQTDQLKELWSLAVERNRQLQMQRKTVRSSQLQVDIQKTTLLPTLRLQGGYNYVSELARFEIPFVIPGVPQIEIEAGVKNQYDLSVLISQPLFTGFELRNTLRSVKELALSQSAQFAIQKNRLLLQVGLLYYQIVANLLQQKALEQSIQRADVHLQQIRAFLKAGQATPLDTLEVANRKFRLQTQLSSLRHDKIILENKLRSVVSVDSTFQFMYPEKMPFPTEAISTKKLVEMAYQNRPEVDFISHLQRKQLFRKRALQSGYFPKIFASASYHYARPGVNFFKDEWMKYYTIGVNLRWDLWQGGRIRKSVQQAQVEYEKLDIEVQQLRQDILRQVKEAIENLKSAKEEIQLNRQLLNKEQERFRMMQNQFKQGQVSSLDFSDAEKSLTSATLQLKTSIIKYYITRLQLAYYTGTIGKK